MTHRQRIRITLKTALLSALFTACTLHAWAQDGSPAAPPQTPAAQDAPPAPTPTPTIKLPTLKPRPGYVIGRAVFADGRPIPSFTVTANTNVGGGVGGQAGGSNGRYVMPIQDATVYVTDIIAYAHLTYQGQDYVLRMCPMDGKPDGLFPDRFVGNIKKGIVRDFVFRLAGIWPGYATHPLPPNVTDNDSVTAYSAFEGCPISVLSGLGRDAHPTLVITLTPTGPLIDGSRGAVIQRQIPNVNAFASFGVYDIPLGAYTATAGEIAPDGTLKPHKVMMSVVGTTVTSGDTPQNSVPITFVSDIGRYRVLQPTLTVVP